RTKVLDLIDKSPGLKADREWIATVQALIPLIKKIKTRTSPSWTPNPDVGEREMLEMIWQNPREALGKLIGWIEVTLLMESQNKQAPAPDEAFQELQTILQKRPTYMNLAVEIVKTEIQRYDRVMRVKKAMENFVAINS